MTNVAARTGDHSVGRQPGQTFVRVVLSWVGWSLTSSVSVAVSVAFSVLLISVSAGVRHGIDTRLASPVIRQSGMVDVDRINTILTLLTAVVTGAMMVQTAATTFVIGVTMMRARRETIAIRRQSGVLRSNLMREFTRDVLRACLVGGIVGEAVGILAAFLIEHLTVLPVQFTATALFAAFPVTVLLALAATLIPAWQAANTSPALLRRE